MDGTRCDLARGLLEVSDVHGQEVVARPRQSVDDNRQWGITRTAAGDVGLVDEREVAGAWLHKSPRRPIPEQSP